MLAPMSSQIGRQKLPVDGEKARMQVGEIGYTEAAKRTGIARNTLDHGTIATNGAFCRRIHAL